MNHHRHLHPSFARVFPLVILLPSLISHGWSSEITADETMEMIAEGNITVEEEAELAEEDEEPAMAVLFPSFTLVIGVIIFFILSRYLHALPYTGVMFLLGVITGIISSTAGISEQFSTTIEMWTNINSEVLLLIFLPGLVFKDSEGQNVHLFLYSMSQLFIFAFPMVLAGAALTALIAFYIFPFGWSFNLALTFGSILAATDPVAVAALLEEVGAPPRLQVHIAGESLLNDGSAIVFFSVFSARYYYEFGIPGFGDDVDWGNGIALFCKKALGGVAVGLFFGFSLLSILYLLNRRFSREENIVQVTAIIGVAYLNYYVADFVWETSGVIASVAAGLVLKLFGRAMVNDPKLLEDFLALLEHILNTLLFTLGGTIWGVVIAEGDKHGVWRAREWGYLILLYLLLHAIRLFIFVVGYPITVRIGLKTNWQETVFQVYGGLRGAVGIALAIALDNEVTHVTGGEWETTEQIQVKQAFGMVGGIAFMTLAINGPTAGPLIRKLGLADSTEARKKLVSAYRVRFRAQAIQDMVKLLCQQRFEKVNFALVKHHVPYLADLTITQLLEAVEKHKAITPEEEYYPPHLSLILPYLIDDSTSMRHDVEVGNRLNLIISDHAAHARKMRIAQRSKTRRSRCKWSASNIRLMMETDSMSVQELRILFISILKTKYDEQIHSGELDDNHILAVSLDKSLDLAEDAVSHGKPLDDWNILIQIHTPIVRMFERLHSKTAVQLCCMDCPGLPKRSQGGFKLRAENLYIERSMTFMAAHKAAQAFFTEELQDVDQDLSEGAKIVIEESKQQYKMAEDALALLNSKVVELAISHKFCRILLTMGIIWVEHVVKLGLFKESEAEPIVDEIEEELDHVLSCEMTEHPNEIKVKSENGINKEVPQDERPSTSESGEITKDGKLAFRSGRSTKCVPDEIEEEAKKIWE